MLGHKTSPNEFKKTEIISSLFSDHNAMKLEINHEKKTKKYPKIWKLNNMLLNNKWVNNKTKEEIKRYLAINENENKTTQNQWNTGKAILKEKFMAMQAYLKKHEKGAQGLGKLQPQARALQPCHRTPGRASLP